MLILGCWVFNLTCGKKKNSDTSKLTAYINDVKSYIDSSNAIAKDWQNLKSTLSQQIADPNQLDSKLKDMVDRSNDVYKKTSEISVPQDMERPASALSLCLEQRYRGMEKYRTDLLNAVSTLDLDIFSQNMAEDAKEFLYSDGNYKYFKNKANDILKQNNLTDVSIMDSQWITSLDDLNPTAVKGSLQSARGSEVHGVALGTVTLSPSGTVDSNNVHHLPDSDEISVTVTVQNQGNRKETQVTIGLALYSDIEFNPQRMESAIESLEAGASVDVVFKGLVPTKGGSRNVLELKANPVPGEAFTENNSKVIYFVMK